MTITVKGMATYNISNDGQTITLSLEDEAGKDTSLQFRIPDLGNLAITLRPHCAGNCATRRFATHFRWDPGPSSSRRTHLP